MGTARVNRRLGVGLSYQALHHRLRKKLTDNECWSCGDTDGPFVNACVNPTRWSSSGSSRLLLVGNDEHDYRRMCRPCSFTYDANVNREALAEYFGVPLPA